MANTNYLYKNLIDINKKYDSTSFVDIDFIELFNIKSIDTSNIKKIITTKYYGLALKYHPDKYANTKEESIEINNISIDISDIRSGQFLSFITDLYKILINMISEDKDTLIRLIEGEDILAINFGGDHSTLKKHFNNKQSMHIEIDEEHIKSLKEVIIDNKIDIKELDDLINQEIIKRDNLQIENIFVSEDIKSDGFKTIFNDKFETTIDKPETNTNTNKDILPYNELNTNLKLVSNRLATSISDISEAFEPIQINRKIKNQIISYEELLKKREEDSNNFKVAKNFKKESID